MCSQQSCRVIARGGCEWWYNSRHTVHDEGKDEGECDSKTASEKWAWPKRKVGVIEEEMVSSERKVSVVEEDKVLLEKKVVSRAAES